MIRFNPDPVIKSMFRISELCKLIKKDQDPIAFWVLKRESQILVERAVKFRDSLLSEEQEAN